MIEHGSSLPGLVAELLLAIAGATLVAAVLARWPAVAFMGVVSVALVAFLPAALAAILLGPADATAALLLACLPILSWGWRRLPARMWKTARELGGSRLLVARALILPSLAPFLAAALLLGVALMAIRWQLDSHPKPFYLPDPVGATG